MHRGFPWRHWHVIPDQVKVGGLDIEVRVLPGIHMLEEGAFGTFRISSQRIDLCGELADGLRFQTLLHEIIHAICFERAIPLKEREVDQLANGILAFLVDNGFIE